jgi:hypothetical protein
MGCHSFDAWISAFAGMMDFWLDRGFSRERMTVACAVFHYPRRQRQESLETAFLILPGDLPENIVSDSSWLLTI